MIDQAYVDKWLDDFLQKLTVGFGRRLVWVSHHGSWARGESRPESDIDCVVVLETIEKDDLITFREIMFSMPDAQKLGSGVLYSIAELKQAPRSTQIELFYGRRILHGSIEGIVKPPESEHLIDDIRLKLSGNMEAARHYLLYPHDLPKVVHNLKYHFKNCFYALQSWILLTKGRFINTKTEMIEILEDTIDKEVLRVARDWYKITDDLTNRAQYYIELLEKWSRGMIRKLELYEET